MNAIALSLFIALPILQAVCELSSMHLTGTLRKPRQPEWTYYAVALPYKAMLVVGVVEALLQGLTPPLTSIVIGALLTLLGIAIRVRGHFELAGSFSPYVETFEGQPIRRSGMYAWVRHPMYVGSTLIFIGLPLLLPTPATWVFALLAFAGLLFRIHQEEKFLAQQLPGYREYMQQTWRLIPHVF